MATVGQQLTTAETGWQRYDAHTANPKFTLTGTWSVDSASAYYNGAMAYTSTQGATVKFQFKGTKLRFISVYNTNHSANISVIIDGAAEVMSLQNNVVQQVLAYEKTGLADTLHNVEIVLNDTAYLVMDAFDVDDTGYIVTPIGTQLTSPDPGWQRYDEAAGVISYKGTWEKQTQASAYGGSQTQSVATGSKYEFIFVGTKIRIMDALYTNRDTNVKVTIDGVSEYYSAYGAALQWQTLVYEKSGLADTRHEVSVEKISGDASAIALDSIDIDETGRLLHVDEVLDVKELSVGKRIRAHYTGTANAVGTFSGLGQETAGFIPPASSATPNGDFYFIVVDSSNGKKKLISNVNIQHSISWDNLNSSGVASGSGLPIDFGLSSQSKSFIRLPTGGVDGNDTANEWNQYIVRSSLGGVISPGDNAVWNWSAMYSASSTTSGINTHRAVRGGTVVTDRADWVSNSPQTNVGFRPVLEIETADVLKILILHAGEYKVFNESLQSWEVVGTVADETLFTQKGMDGIVTIPKSAWSELVSFEVLVYTSKPAAPSVQLDYVYPTVGARLLKK